MLLGAFILGLLGSLHCIGMCGPIALMLPVDRSKPLKRFIQTLSYHVGRITAYALIGLVLGVVGKSFSIFGLQQYLSIAMGILLIVVIILPKQKLQRFKIASFLHKFIAKIKQQLGASLKKKTADTFLTLGVLNGFLPCGLVYIAVFSAIAMGSLWESSMYMVFFGLGTVPLMTVAVYAAGFLKEITRRKIQKLIPTFVVILGALFILRGLGLGIPYVSPKPATEMVSSKMECHSP